MLTKKQKELFDFITTYQESHCDLSPTYQEMADGVGLRSKSGINRLLKGLSERGFIRRLANRARAIEIIKGA